MRRLLFVWLLVLAACGSPGIPTPTVANDEQMVRDALLGYVRQQGQTGLFQVKTIKLEAPFAFAVAEPAEGQQLDPLQAYLKRDAGTWTVLTAGTAFDSKQLQDLGIPKTLWQDSTFESEPAPPAVTNTTGGISGHVAYPSERIPALDVFALNLDHPTLFYHLALPAETQSYTLTGIEPGSYYVLAYLGSTADNPNPDYAGGYTPAVACGLTAECTDHALLEVQVAAGTTTTNIDLTDWYAPPATFPKRPEGSPQPTRTP